MDSFSILTIFVIEESDYTGNRTFIKFKVCQILTDVTLRHKLSNYYIIIIACNFTSALMAAEIDKVTVVLGRTLSQEPLILNTLLQYAKALRQSNSKHNTISLIVMADNATVVVTNSKQTIRSITICV